MGPLFLACQVVACAGEPRVLEPRAPPGREMPAVNLPATPPPVGEGRVVLDAIDGPMNVTVQADTTFVPPGATVAPSRTGELCVTPCAADLPLGRYRLFLSSRDGEHGDTDDLVVSQGVTVYRRAAGKYVSPSVANRILPASVFVLGLVVASVGLAVSEGTTTAQSGTSGSSGTPVAGLVLLGLGVAMAIGGGIWTYDASRAVQQQGATTTWQESP